jgi:hypothetical protein
MRYRFIGERRRFFHQSGFSTATQTQERPTQTKNWKRIIPFLLRSPIRSVVRQSSLACRKSTVTLKGNKGIFIRQVIYILRTDYGQSSIRGTSESPRHTWLSRYRCSLPGLAGFAGPRCTEPEVPRLGSRPSRDCRQKSNTPFQRLQFNTANLDHLAALPN